MHSYGLAIDINPVQNPYISVEEGENARCGLAKILPPAGHNYLNRTHHRPGMVEAEGLREIFKKHGFPIGGDSGITPLTGNLSNRPELLLNF